MQERKRRIAILCEGYFGDLEGKTASGLIMYKPEEVVAVIDSTQAGKTSQEILGYGGDIPVESNLANSLKHGPNALLIGIAPRGGKLPPEWQGIVRSTLVVGALAFGIWSGIISQLTVSVLVRWGFWAITVLSAIATGDIEGGLAATALTICVNYLSKRAVRGDARDVGLRTLAYRLVRRWGTRFGDADLTDADFRGVDTRLCDFTGATLDGVRWEPGSMPIGDVTDETP